MSFSRLLLVASSSKKFIMGEGKNDKVVIKPRKSDISDDPYSGEVVLCFQLDDTKDEEKQKRIARILGIQDEQDDKIICLVEMKSTNISEAAKQIISTRDRVKKLLLKECGDQCNKEIQKIKWKACLYHHNSSLNNIAEFQKELKKDGDIEVETLTSADNNIGPFLRGEVSAKNMTNKYRPKKK